MSTVCKHLLCKLKVETYCMYQCTFSHSKLISFLLLSLGSPIITTGLIIVNNSDGSSELRVNTIGTNLQYQWSINNTVVNGTTQRVVKKDKRHLKLNGRWNGTLKVDYLVWNNDYSGIRHERKQVFVVNPYYIGKILTDNYLY